MHSILVVGSGNAFNTDGRGNTAFLLYDYSEDALLIDCGPTVVMNLQKFAPESVFHIRDILITHFHGDHFGGIPFLILTMAFTAKRSEPLFIHGPEGIRNITESLIQLTLPGYTVPFEIIYNEVSQGSFKAGAFSVKAVKINHRPESLGYRITGKEGNNAAFTGDSSFDKDLLNCIQGVSLAVMELSLSEQPAEGQIAHVSFNEVKPILSEGYADQYLFAHTDNAIVSAANQWLTANPQSSDVIMASDGIRLEWNKDVKIYEIT
jgi:ribonuclease BN (tRNA processing enzyme)